MTEIGKSLDEALRYVQTVPPRQGETMHGVPFEKLDAVRFGFIGVGKRGYGMLGQVLAVEGARVMAIGDSDEGCRQRAKERVEQAGQPAPALEADWRKICERSDVDVVFVCSPWDQHTPMAVYAMRCGKHAAVEVPAATTLSECWLLVDASEHTRRHCVMMENCCYGQNEMLALNMVRAGVFGTITHGEAAYIHELRSMLLGDKGAGLWRREAHKNRNGNLYPTHGLGPVAWYMNVNHGDRLARIVSMSSMPAALGEYRDAHCGDGSKKDETYSCGDMNSSLLQTAGGRSILLQHDVVTPRPYSRINLVQGTRGIFCDYPARVYVDGAHAEEPGKHEWTPAEEFRGQYEHSFWRKHGELAGKMGGHGGMDYLMAFRLVQLIREGKAPDMDVYDAAAWSAPGPLSDISVAWGNVPLPYPDFTRGHWQDKEAVAAWNKNLCDTSSVIRPAPAAEPSASDK